MSAGSKWQLFIPSDLAYGPRGTGGGPIGPNATLIFEVELVAIGVHIVPKSTAIPDS
jgi:FKBP-type peptidyl-prolyl cis-trans isomerase